MRATERNPRLTGRLLKRYDRLVPRMRSLLVSRFGAEEAGKFVVETRREYEALIPRIPYIGGVKNPLSWNLNGSALFLAMWRVLKCRGVSPQESVDLFCEMSDLWLRSYPKRLVRLLGRLRFTRPYRGLLKKKAEASRKRRYPADFVYDYVEGDGGDFEFGVDYTECAILKFLRERGSEQIAPHVCRIDYPMSRALGLGMERTGTLAGGAPRCDFRFKRGRPTREPPAGRRAVGARSGPA